jgi:hypothetical protein
LTLNFFKTFCMISSSSPPANPESFAGLALPTSSFATEFSDSLGKEGGGVVVVVVVVEDPSLLLVTMVFEVSLLALVRSPVIVFPSFVFGCESAAAFAASSEITVVAVSTVVSGAGVGLPGAIGATVASSVTTLVPSTEIVSGTGVSEVVVEVVDVVEASVEVGVVSVVATGTVSVVAAGVVSVVVAGAAPDVVVGVASVVAAGVASVVAAGAASVVAAGVASVVAAGAASVVVAGTDSVVAGVAVVLSSLL